MRKCARKKSALLVFVLILSVVVCPSSFAQTAPESTTFHSQTNVVLVPTLVMNKSGDVVFGLTGKDFVIEDDGVEQNARLDDAPEQEPISIVVAIQTGRSAYLHIDGRNDDPLPGDDAKDCRTRKNPCTTTTEGLATMLRSFIGESKGQVAVVAFDSQVKLLHDFTSDVESLSRPLKTLQPGDGGAAILDAVAYSLGLLEKRPKNERRVLLVISETRDHGSHQWNLEEVVQRLTLSSTLVYSVAFSPSKSELKRDLKGENPQAGYTNLLAPIILSVNGMKKNMARAIAEMSGGEYQMFKNKQTFDTTLGVAANHANNRYELSFQPKTPKPGPHVITVRLREPRKDITVTARSSYWAVASK